MEEIKEVKKKLERKPEKKKIKEKKVEEDFSKKIEELDKRVLESIRKRGVSLVCLLCSGEYWLVYKLEPYKPLFPVAIICSNCKNILIFSLDMLDEELHYEYIEVLNG